MTRCLNCQARMYGECCEFCFWRKPMKTEKTPEQEEDTENKIDDAVERQHTTRIGR